VARVEVQPLRLAELELPEWHPEGPGSCVLLGFLVRDGGQRFLVDTGVGAHPVIDKLYRPRRADLLAALREIGVEREQVSAIVNSHLHFDHCGNNPLFPGVPTFVQHDELEASREPHYTILEHVDFEDARHQRVHGRTSLSAHVELIPTPGHTPGHQSVLVDADGGRELIVAQAAYSADEFESWRSGEAEVPEGHWSPLAYRESLRELHALRPRRAYFSHDAAVWRAG
jgi:N-acyl homoserine lactone hydrolase